MAYPQLILAADASRIGQDPRLLAKRCRHGELVRVRRGVYVPAEHWAALNDRQRHGVQAAALQDTAIKTPIFNGQTSALLWGLGIIGCPSQLCTVTDDPVGGRSKHGIRRTLGSTTTGVCQLGDVWVTDKARTAVELTSTLNFAEALAVVDSSRRSPSFSASTELADWDKDRAWGPAATLKELTGAMEHLRSESRRRRVSGVLDLSTDLAESPGESMSRAQMILLNVPSPELQASFTLKNGRIARTDFYWPELGLVGELDGQGKYLREELRGTRTIQDVVMAEKARENALRALGLNMIRWDWADMMNPKVFAQILGDAGLKPLRALDMADAHEVGLRPQ